MLGEGFDHPPLSVAAIFRPFRSLSPYIQFVGRVMRVTQEGSPGHRDNQAYIVSHIGLNNDEHWDDFRELDLADQQMFKDLVRGQLQDGETVDDEGAGEPRRFDVGMQVMSEVLGQHLTSHFLDLDDDRVIDQLLQAVVPGAGGLTFGQISGMDRDSLRARLKQLAPPPPVEPPAEIPVSPQRQRQYFRKRLSERSNSVVARILKDLGLGLAARDVGRAFKATAALDNRRAVTELLNRAINKHVGIPSNHRAQMSLEQAKIAFESLDTIADRLSDEIASALEIK